MTLAKVYRALKARSTNGAPNLKMPETERATRPLAAMAAKG